MKVPEHMLCQAPGCPLAGTLSSDAGLDRAYCNFHFQAPKDRTQQITDMVKANLPLIIFAKNMLRRRVGSHIENSDLHWMEKNGGAGMAKGCKTSYQVGTAVIKALSDSVGIASVAKGENKLQLEGGEGPWNKLRDLSAALKQRTGFEE